MSAWGAFAPQQDVQPAVAKAPPQSSDLAETGSNETILGPPAAIADRTAIRTDRLACPPFVRIPLQGLSQIVHAAAFPHFTDTNTRALAHTPDIGPDPDREEFAPDSPLEGGVSSELVSEIGLFQRDSGR